MNINKEEGRERQQQKQSRNFCTGAPAHKKGNWDQTGPRLSHVSTQGIWMAPDLLHQPEALMSVHSLGQGVIRGH